jgi:hypothetical protein
MHFGFSISSCVVQYSPANLLPVLLLNFSFHILLLLQINDALQIIIFFLFLPFENRYTLIVVLLPILLLYLFSHFAELFSPSLPASLWLVAICELSNPQLPGPSAELSVLFI